MRCRVEATVIGRDWSLRLGPGLVIDLEQDLAPDLKVRDVVEVSWFEPVTPASAEEE